MNKDYFCKGAIILMLSFMTATFAMAQNKQFTLEEPENFPEIENKMHEIIKRREDWRREESLYTCRHTSSD